MQAELSRDSRSHKMVAGDLCGPAKDHMGYKEFKFSELFSDFKSKEILFETPNFQLFSNNWKIFQH